jgi:hypothetical protein
MNRITTVIAACCVVASMGFIAAEEERDQGGGGGGMLGGSGALQYHYWQKGRIESCILWRNQAGKAPVIVLFVIRSLPDMSMPRSYARHLDTPEGDGFSFGTYEDRWLKYVAAKDFSKESLHVLGKHYPLTDGRILMVDARKTPLQTTQVKAAIPKIRITERGLYPSREDHLQALAELASENSAIKEFLKAAK